MYVSELEALQSIQETYVTMNDPESLDEGLSKEHLSAIKKHYSNHNHIMADVGDYVFYKKHGDHKSAESIAKKLKSIAKDDKVIMSEKFAHPNHKKLDANGNGKLDAQDFALLRAKKKGLKNFKEFKESIQIDEKTLSPEDMKQREKIVKGMKKNSKEFKDKYGEKSKHVMYATATKMATKD